MLDGCFVLVEVALEGMWGEVTFCVLLLFYIAWGWSCGDRCEGRVGLVVG